MFWSVCAAQRDAVLCAAILTALAANAHFERTLELYDALAPLSQSNAVCHVMALRACAALKEYARGRQLHKQLGECDGKVRDALICFYCACGDTLSAEQLFDATNLAQLPLKYLSLRSRSYCRCL